ncbi:MAG TPA: hypothetical protein VGB24_07155 [Longimicrobium sp.]|uniref:hypothetical protein n=1 Tax=Longimicrobium sp. TaxID=2029185 RepID=UPI002EDACE75
MPLASPTADRSAAPAARRDAVWILAAVLACGWFVARYGQAFMGPETLLCLVVGAVILAPVAVRLATGTFDLFEPMVLVTGLYLLYFVVGPLVRFSMDDMVFVGYDFEQVYAGALLAVLVVAGSLWAGYAVPVGPRPGSMVAHRRSWDPEAARRLGWGLVVLALVFMLLWARIAGRSLGTFFLPGLFGSMGGGGDGPDIPYLFLAIEWFTPALLVLVIAGALRGPWSRAAAILLITIVYVSIGFRYRVVILWIAFSMLLYLKAGKRPRLAVLVPAVMGAFLFVGWLAWARLFFRSGGANGGLSFQLGDVVQGALSDTRVFETFGAVMQVVPQHVDYVGFDPLGYLIILPIPRFLWPEKPLPMWLYDIGGSIGTAESVNLGAAVPHFGEYYFMFGWPGMALGSFLFGMGVRWLWRWYQADPGDSWRQLLLAINTGFLFQAVIRGYLAQVFQEWCFIVLPAIVIMRMCTRPAPPAPGNAHA